MQEPPLTIFKKIKPRDCNFDPKDHQNKVKEHSVRSGKIEPTLHN